MTNAPLTPDERIEEIGGRLRLIVSPAHTFGTDALLLAAFAMPRKTEKACDLGTGCGIIPFYWLARGAERVWGVELQEEACEQARRSVSLNGLEARFTLVEGDLGELEGKLPFQAFDVVSMNPPYTKTGGGLLSKTPSSATARHETAASLAGICRAAAKLLKFGGRFCLCLRPERLPEAMAAMESSGLAPKRLQLVSHRPGKAPWLFLMEGRKGGRPGLTVLPEFHMQTADGAVSEEAGLVYLDYAKE